MPNDPDRRPLVGRAAVSAVAILACALASSNALASRAPAEQSAGEQELSARIATLVEQINLGAPGLKRHLPPERKVAWRN
jgi:hypothetical protein